MAVDETGVYFFTTIEDHNKILVKLSNYMNQLALSKKDMVVCYLGWEVAPITDDVFLRGFQTIDFRIFFLLRSIQIHLSHHYGCCSVHVQQF